MKKYFRAHGYETIPKIGLTQMWKEFRANSNICDIWVDSFLLNFFYAWMTIYVPIYLKWHIGFSWQEIGLLISIALLPFLLFQYPLGRLADKKLGEKEILILGFLVTSITLFIIPLLNTTNFFAWAGLLFATRVGASFIEISTETYFFKKVSAENVGMISF